MKKLCNLFWVALICSCLVSCEIPENIQPEFEAVFKGEGLDCEGTSAAVQVQSERNEVVGEGEVRAITEAVVQALRIMREKPTIENAVSQADATSKLVLEVVALARASVSAQINSPNPGCFALAFGKAEAVAVAKAAVTAIAEAFAQASSTQGDLQQNIGSNVENIEKDIQVAVERVVLLLADGSGGGEKSEERSVEAEARAKVVNCALASAFAQVGQGVAEAEVKAQAGCIEPEKQMSTRAAYDATLADDCECAKDCGLYGDQQNGDYICYMKSEQSCKWAQKSTKYEGKAWRYCGPTMEKMQTWLKLSDKANFIDAMATGYGYSGSWDYKTDKMAPAPSTPPPNPPTPPTPPATYPSPTPTLTSCPIFRCFGTVGACCQLHGAATCYSRYGQVYNYGGKCNSNGYEYDVWQKGTFYECVCA